MQSSDLLEAIWRGDIACAGSSDTEARFGLILDAMLPMRRIALQRGDRRGGQVLPEQTELLPALALGDVIEEELELAAPHGALVVILDRAALRPGAGDAARSQLVGRLVGELLVDTVQRGVFATDRETDALYLMAQAYDALARTPRLRRLGLVAASFRAGLASVLASLWTGAAVPGSEADRLLNGPLFLSCERLRAYLATLDACFTAPSAGLAGAGLVGFAEAGRGHDGWLRDIGGRLDAILRDSSTAQGETADRG
ncbi:hypothetical protein [Limimaricola hongkongensis]|uniref:Uncharacterized protein n=1 Tax=Limimaricola hongkongensis DSM 17492 TaxID=1122180 RepID=A0A017HCT3_9RHOB|nr:hypothetical protein [Limimaricola hongkongensis]EYD71963.1 hypothetical protein Lokhon_02035 [Limimaricola hongkongensis DSM 17492]